MGLVPCLHRLQSTMNEIKSTYRRKVKHYDISFHAHELTFSCYHRYNYLNDTAVCKIFLEELEAARIRFDFKIWAYVLMPNHVHLLIFPKKKKYQTAKILQHIKAKTAQRYRKKILAESPEQFEQYCVTCKGVRVFRLWQAGAGFDRNLWNPKAIHNVIGYIEGNPVRAKLVEKPEDWPWSSARARQTRMGSMSDTIDVPFLMK